MMKTVTKPENQCTWTNHASRTRTHLFCSTENRRLRLWHRSYFAGCEVAPDVNVAAQKFLIRLLIPAPEGMNEVFLRCQDVSPYAHAQLSPRQQFSQNIDTILPPHRRPSPPSQEQQYAQWMAACRLGSKGKTLADSSFRSEIESIRSFLHMQKSNPSSHGNAAASDESINTHSLVSPRYHKKYKAKQVQTRWNTFQRWYCWKRLLE